MRDLKEIIRSGLSAAKTRRDVIELCRRTLSDLESQAYEHKLFIRYMQPLHVDVCGGHVDGISLSGVGAPAHKIAVGIAFINPTDVHPINGIRGIYAGGAVCHPADPWSKDLGKTIAVLRSKFIPGDIAANMAIRMSPWDHTITTSEKTLRTGDLKYPWSVMLNYDDDDVQTFPNLAHPAIVDAIRYAIRYCLGGAQPFSITASTAHMALPESVPSSSLVDELIDKACKLPSCIPLTPEEHAEKEKEGRAAAAMSDAPTPSPGCPTPGFTAIGG